MTAVGISSTTRALAPGQTPTRAVDENWWHRNKSAVYVGAAVGGPATLLTSFAFGLGNRSLSRSFSMGAATGIAIGGAAALINHVVNGDRDALPPLPRLDNVPSLPALDLVDPRPYEGIPANTTVATINSSGTDTTTDSDGNVKTEHWSDSDALQIVERIGHETYATASAALRVTPRGEAAVAVKTEAGYVPYLAWAGDGWSGLDDIDVARNDIAAVATPGGVVFDHSAKPSDTRTLYSARTSVERTDPTPQLNHEALAVLAQAHGSDGAIRGYATVSGPTPFGDLAGALADAGARPGLHAVTQSEQGYHVLRIYTTGIDPNRSLLGVRTTELSDQVKALESFDTQLVPAGGYWVEPAPRD